VVIIISGLTHFNDSGLPRMVNVGGKPKTAREATARAIVSLSAETYALVQAGKMKKGDVLACAQVAGIMAAKKTGDIIPMCHPIALTAADITFTLNDNAHTITVEATTRCVGETGVEMEAMTAVAAASLTIYDMCKAVQRDITISEIRLIHKSGGKSGEYNAD